MLNNPLSYAQHMHQDLTALVRTALAHLGMPAQSLLGFDACSTIQIEYADRLQLNIAVQDDRLWLWSVVHCSEAQLLENDQQVLPLLAEALQGVETGHLVLGRSDEGYELKALLDLGVITQEAALATLIEQFYLRLKAINQSIGG